MKKVLFPLLALGSYFTLNGCQQPQSAGSTPMQDDTATTASAGATTEAQARAAIAKHLQQQPNAALFQLDSARFMNLDTHWQVMVPRTDWAKRMPNAAAFEVDKKTGSVSTLMVK